MDRAEEINLEDEAGDFTPFQLYKQSWVELLSAPNDLWLIYSIRFLNYHRTTIFLSTLLLYLSDVKEISDSILALLFVIYGVSGFVFVIVFGNFPDRYGVKICLIVASFLFILEFVLLIFLKNVFVQILVALCLGAIPGAILAPALDSSIKFYSGKRSRTLAVSFYSTVTYAASLLGGVFVEAIFVTRDKDEFAFTVIFIYCAFISFISIIVSLWVKDTDYQYYSIVSDNKPKINKESGWKHTKQALGLKNVWRYLALSLLIVLTRIVSMQTYIMLPLYMDRDLGSDAFYGLTVIVAQLIVILTLPISGYTFYFFKPYSVYIIAGTFYCIAPLGFLFGASYYAIFFFVTMVAIGDSLYSARLLEYAYEVAPKGKESVIIGIGYMPISLGFIVAGISGGLLMEEYCPHHGEKECWKAWLWTIFLAFPSVICMILLRKWTENKQNEQNPYIPCCKLGSDEASKES